MSWDGLDVAVCDGFRLVGTYPSENTRPALSVASVCAAGIAQPFLAPKSEKPEQEAVKDFARGRSAMAMSGKAFESTSQARLGIGEFVREG